MVPLQLSNIFSVAIGGSHHSDLKTNLAPPTRSSLKVVAIIWEMAMSLISRSAVGLTGPDLHFSDDINKNSADLILHFNIIPKFLGCINISADTLPTIGKLKSLISTHYKQPFPY